MSEKVTVNGKILTLDTQGSSSGWGETQHDLMVEIIASVNAFFSEGDILPTSTLIANSVGTDGEYDAATNIPVLADGSGTQYDMYYVSVAGTQDFGAGDIIFEVGDFVQYDGSVWVNTNLDNQDISRSTVIPFFQFDSSVVRFAEIEYTVIRASSGCTNHDNETIYEVGKIFVLNDPTASSNAWSLNIQSMSNSTAGIGFNINNSGQVTYVTDFMDGTYVTAESKIVFKAKSIIK